MYRSKKWTKTVPEPGMFHFLAWKLGVRRPFARIMGSALNLSVHDRSTFWGSTFPESYPLGFNKLCCELMQKEETEVQ